MPPAQCSILVLEDEPAILRLVTATLQSTGLGSVSAACSIGEAREFWRARNGLFDLLITDFSLPDGSASDFIGELFAENPSLPVVVTSGFSEEMLDMGQVGGRVTLLQKPFRPSELRTLVLRLVS